MIPDLLPVGSGWSEWSEYTPCSVTCGTGSKSRQRYCQDSDPDQCEGKAKEATICVDKPRCPGERQDYEKRCQQEKVTNVSQNRRKI